MIHTWVSRILAVLALLLPVAASAELGPEGQIRGDFPTAYLFLTFTDDRSEPQTMATLAQWSQAPDAFFRAMSYGTVTLSPSRVFGYVHLDIPKPSGAACNLPAIQAAADAKAAALGFVRTAYKRWVYVSNDTTCRSGAASEGVVWIGAVGAFFTASHELGHEFGLSHSHAFACTTSTLTPPCHSNEYGDITDTMGGSVAGQFNPFQKIYLGWLGGIGTPTLTTVTQSGTYTIRSYDDPALSPKALRIVRHPETGHYFYVRLATSGLYDLVGAPPPVFPRLFLYLGIDGCKNCSYLLDMSPTTVRQDDPYFLPGQTFTDPETGLTIRADAVSPDAAVLTVTFPSAPPPPPVPDRDGDGTPDAFDLCPDVPGDRSNAGCPIDAPPSDRDDDGVVDLDDHCPDVPGTVANNGCPDVSTSDRDGDGVPDALDHCPDIAGSVANGGCPDVLPPPVALTLTGHSALGREMTFRGGYVSVGKPVLVATVDGRVILARYVVVDATRKIWSAKVTSLYKGTHTFTISAGPDATVSETFTVLK